MPSSTSPSSSRHYLPLLLAVLVFVILQWFSFREMGLVGEVSIGWNSGKPPQVLSHTSPVTWADGIRAPNSSKVWGPLIANQTRPTERLRIGSLDLPLAINNYTGGFVDWPARLLHFMTGSMKLVQYWHILLGISVIVLVHQLLWRYSSWQAAAIAAMWLSTDWGFAFYKRALGATEVGLQIGWILCIWACLQRQQNANRWLLFALGIGLGLHSKAPFAFSLIALLGSLIVLQRSNIRAWKRRDLVLLLLVVTMFLTPLLLSIVHHMQWETTIRSHDTLQLQWQRVERAFTGSGTGNSRENFYNLWIWLTDPLQFFHKVYHAPKLPSLAIIRGVSLLIALLATLFSLRSHTQEARLLRWIGLLLAGQLLILGWLAKDMHHLAISTPTMAVWIALSLSYVAQNRKPLLLLLLSPWLCVGSFDQLRSDQLLRAIPTPTFATSSQQRLQSFLTKYNVQRLVTMDYEIYGLLQSLTPDIEVIHGWGAISHQRWKALPQLVNLAAGHHLLVVQATSNLRYNLQPASFQLEEHAQSNGLVLHKVAAWEDEKVVLYYLDNGKTTPNRPLQ